MNSSKLQIIKNFLTGFECDEWIKECEKIGFTLATINSNGIQIEAKEIRNNQRVIIDDKKRAARYWERLSGKLEIKLDGWIACGLNERFRIYRYGENNIFRFHRDESFKRNGEESKLSILMYLNEDFQGGETDFREFKVNPEKGMASVFKHELLHEGSCVKNGIKYAIRTDVMFKKLT